MKSKKTTCLLLVLVLVLWAAVFRKVSTHFAPEALPVAPAPRPAAPVAPLLEPTGLFDYPDPFLGNDSPAAPPPDTGEAGVPPPPPAPPLPERPPALQFRGTIRRGATLYALIAAAGTTEIAAAGDSVGGYRVRKVTADSIQVQQERKTHTLYP